MKKTLLIFVTTFLTSITSFAQTFEGKVIYTNSYKSKIPNIADDQFTSMMGATQEYFIKNGNYKSVANGTLFQSQYYINSENKLYTKMANAEAFLWNDGSTNPDEVIKYELNKGIIDILGYKCDELVLTCKNGVQKYYFNSKFSVDSKAFVNHKFGNWYDFVSKSNSLPLKSVIENAQFSLESTATSITEMKLDNSFFTLPSNSKTMKSPY
ncbi:hypothetical protein L0657_08400 [Dyadobacter sp. CY345]|uniref:hypothetical protein n=1 Tax=Dyadobacter sp. CY345 TaxID=2909335 RepID=UPI001F1ECD5C|nr:hypothetical protein [Dyadobacter sp. CY345]MCF2443972.1 hypothetical protein [Dyadobacter sp. CY345]